MSRELVVLCSSAKSSLNKWRCGISTRVCVQAIRVLAGRKGTPSAAPRKRDCTIGHACMGGPNRHSMHKIVESDEELKPGTKLPSVTIPLSC
jgi:hypothetical protein